jgi:hypothetical protein
MSHLSAQRAILAAPSVAEAARRRNRHSDRMSTLLMGFVKHLTISM